jgi:hypothetical protein
MTLANKRANGVRSLAIRCDLCHYEAVLNVDRLGDDVPVPSFGRAWSAQMRDYWCRRAAELAGKAGAGELDRVKLAIGYRQAR